MSIPLKYLLQKLDEGHHGHLLFSGVSSVSTRDADGPGVFKVEKGDGVGDRRSGDITSQCTDTLAGFLDHAPGIWMLKFPHPWAIFNCKNIRIFRLSASGLKAFNRTINYHKCTATGYKK